MEDESIKEFQRIEQTQKGGSHYDPEKKLIEIDNSEDRFLTDRRFASTLEMRDTDSSYFNELKELVDELPEEIAEGVIPTHFEINEHYRDVVKTDLLVFPDKLEDFVAHIDDKFSDEDSSAMSYLAAEAKNRLEKRNKSLDLLSEDAKKQLIKTEKTFYPIYRSQRKSENRFDIGRTQKHEMAHAIRFRGLDLDDINNIRKRAENDIDNFEDDKKEEIKKLGHSARLVLYSDEALSLITEALDTETPESSKGDYDHAPLVERMAEIMLEFQSNKKGELGFTKTLNGEIYNKGNGFLSDPEHINPTLLIIMQDELPSTDEFSERGMKAFIRAGETESDFQVRLLKKIEELVENPKKAEQAVRSSHSKIARLLDNSLSTVRKIQKENADILSSK